MPFVQGSEDGTMHSRRLTAKILLGLILAGTIASVGVVMPRTIRVVGPDETPIEAWAAYHYEGSRFNFADSIAYRRPGALVKTDGDGNLRLAGTIYLHFPLNGWLSPRIDLLYAPELHGVVAFPLAADPAVRIFERSTDGRTLRLADQTGDPELWALSLERLISFVRYDLMGRAPHDTAVDPGTVDVLANQAIADYRSFVERHAATPRTIPTIGVDHLNYASEAEREATLARIRAGLAREPFWGPYMQRIWGQRIFDLEQSLGK